MKPNHHNRRYSLVFVEHEGDFLWCVYEHSTEQVINSFYFEDEAKRYVKFLDRGGAFAGWTPAFFTETKINTEKLYA